MSNGDGWRGELDHVVSDPELITQVRAGDRSAFGELYRRHVGPASTLARQFARSPAEADDLVSEAFARVLDQLLTGQGPDTAFRAYLFTSLRNTAYDRTRKDRRLQFTDDMTGHDRAVVGDDPVVAQVENGLIAAAFARLPERWQAVLWHTQVEGESPAAVGELLGMAPGAVSSLAFRAREGLREAYLQAHLADTAGESCRTTVERLGAWTRGGLSKREKAQVDAHLAGCDRCRTLAAELQEVNTGLRALLAPVLLGAAAAGYLATLGPVVPMAAAGLLGVAAPTGIGGAAMTGTGSGSAVSGGSAGAVSAGATGTGAAATGSTAGATAAGTTAGTLGGAGTVTGTGSLGAAAAGAASGAATGASGTAVGLTAGAAHLAGATGVVATSTVAGVGAGAGVAGAGVIGATAGAGAAAAGAAAVGGAVAGGAALAGTAAAGAAVAGASLATTGLLAVGTAAAAAAVTGSVIALSDVAPSTTVDTAAGTTISAAPTSAPSTLPEETDGAFVLPVDPGLLEPTVTDGAVPTPDPLTDVPVATSEESVPPADQLSLLGTEDSSAGVGTGADLTDLYQLEDSTVPIIPAPVVPVPAPAPVSPVPVPPVAPVETTPSPAPPTTENPAPSTTEPPTTPPSTDTPSTDTPAPSTETPSTDTPAPSTETPSTDTPATSTTPPTDSGSSTDETTAPTTSTSTTEPAPVQPAVQIPDTPLVVTAGTTATVDLDLVNPGTDGPATATTTGELQAPDGLALQTVDVRQVGADGGATSASTVICSDPTRCPVELPGIPAGGRLELAVSLTVAVDTPSSTALTVAVADRAAVVPVTVLAPVPATPQATLTVADGGVLTAGVASGASLAVDQPGPISLGLRSGDLWITGYPDQCRVDGDRVFCPGPTVDGLTVLPRPGSQGPVQPSVTVDGRPAAVTGPDGAALTVAGRDVGAPASFTGPFGGTMVSGSADPDGSPLAIPDGATIFWAELTWTAPPPTEQRRAESAADPAAVDLMRGGRTVRVDGVVPAGAPADGIAVHTADVTAALAASTPSQGDRLAVVPVGDTSTPGWGWSLTVIWSAPGSATTTVTTAGALAVPLADVPQVTVLSAPDGAPPVLAGWATVWRSDPSTAVRVRPPGCDPVELSSGAPATVIAFGACPPPAYGGPETPAVDLTVSAATPADARRSWAGPALIIRALS